MRDSKKQRDVYGRFSSHLCKKVIMIMGQFQRKKNTRGHGLNLSRENKDQKIGDRSGRLRSA